MKRSFLFFVLGMLCLSACGTSESVNNSLMGGVDTPNSETSAPNSSGNGSTPNSETSAPNSSGNGSTSSNQEDEKYSLEDINDLLANVTGANALGITTPTKKPTQALRKNAKDSETQTKNLWVKQTNVYDSSEPSVNPDGTINVSFRKTVTTDSANETTVTKTIRLELQDFEANILEKDANNLYFEKPSGTRQYSVMSGNDVLLDWSAGSVENIKIGEGVNEQEFEAVHLVFDTTKEYIILSKRVDAEYTFQALDGDRYTLTQGDSTLFKNVIDNATGDSNPEKGVITFSGLKEGTDYTLTQVGIRYTQTIEQSDVDGVVDKLYASGRYSFLSFVPGDNSLRPSSDQLDYDENGVSSYDKTDYYSNNHRQSFVVDNISGLVYKIDGFTITKIKNGLIYTNLNDLVYDMRVKENNELEFFPLFTNTSIKVYDAFRDCYGNIYIRNDKINTYDSTTKTFYYVFEEGNESSVKFIDYQLNDKKQALKLVYADEYSRELSDLKLIDANAQEVSISKKDSFKIDASHSVASIRYFEVVDGIARGMDLINSDRFISSSFDLAAYDCEAGVGYWTWCITYNYTPKCQFNLKLARDYDVLLLWDGRDSCLYAIYDFYAHFFDVVTGVWTTTDDYDWIKDPLTIQKVLDSCDIDSNNGCIINYGLSGNTYYDYDIRIENGEREVEVFELGTRIEKVKTVVLQPINL